MKSSKKALAFALAAAMVVTAVPVAPAEAASTAKLSAKSVTVAAGTAKKQSKTIKVTTPSTWKSVKVSAKSNATGTAKVSVSGKTVKVTAVKKGTAKVTVKVTAKKSGKKVSKKLTATAKVVNAGLKVTAPTEVVVGSETKLTAKVCPSAAKVTYKSSDDTTATVDENGTVKAVKAGDVTITATSDYGKTVEKKIAVKKAILKEVKQTKYNQVVATVDGDLSALKASDFTIWNDYSTNVHPVKKLTYDKATSTVTLTTFFEKMTDGKTYNVVLDGVTKQFVASDGVVTSLSVSPKEVTVAKETPIKAVYCDTNGVILKELPYNGGANVDNTLDFTISTTQGYTTATGIYLYEVGNTATASLTLHSNKFDANGNEIGKITATETITAVAAANVTDKSFGIKIGNDGSDFKHVAETVVAKGDQNKTAYIQITKSNGDVSTDLREYTLESSDLNVLILNKQKGTQNGQVKLVPVLAGSCYIIVRDAKDNVIATLPVTVKAERYANSLTLSQYNTTLSNKVFNVTGVTAGAADAGNWIADYTDITAKVLDQYEEAVTVNAGDITYSPKTLDGKTDATQIGAVTGSTITFTAKAATDTGVTTTKGTYIGVVEYNANGKTLSKTFTTTVQQPEDTVDSYQLVLDKTTVDAVITEKAGDDTKVTGNVYGYDGGIKRKVYTSVATWKLSSGNTACNDAEGVNNSNVVSVNDINADKTAINKVNRMDAKNYSLTAEFNCGFGDVNTGMKKSITRQFTVTDSQPLPALTLKNDGKVTQDTETNEFIKAVYPGDISATITGIKTNDATVNDVDTLLAKVKAANNANSYMVYDVYTTTTLKDGVVVKSIIPLNHTVSKDGNW